jgi:excinuclease ABC subunit A
MNQKTCSSCKGQRLKKDALSVKILDSNIHQVSQLSVEECEQWINKCQSEKRGVGLSDSELLIGSQIFKEISSRLKFLNKVGLGYISLNRPTSTLSGGEGQRIRLASQIGSGLTGVLYVCDEPSIGLHPIDNDRLIKTLEGLRNLGNTVLVVEHDESIMRASDHIIDLGPLAGTNGGLITGEGNINQIIKSKNSITGMYLSGKRKIDTPAKRRAKVPGKEINVIGAKENNLKSINVSFPLQMLVCVTGASGSGKSTLVNEILYKGLSKEIYKSKDLPGEHNEITGTENLDKVVNIDQSPIGRTPRSNPATYTALFGPIRDLFSSVPEARSRGYKPGRFSFNVKGGRCENCEGAGYKEIQMQFLPDVSVPCEECKGNRYNKEALEIKFKGLSIADVLNLTVSDALEVFSPYQSIFNKLSTLNDVGLGYIKLGQPATTLSGGEAQRVKLSTYLSKRATGKTLFILDEPTTGLSFEDCNSLIKILHRLVDNKNSVILIEHHLDIIKNADWIVDLGPGAGAEGGKLIAQGTPENIAYKDDSFTGLYLKKDSGIVPKRGSAISTNLKRSASIKKPKETAFSFPDRTPEKDYTIKKRSSRFRRSRSYS